MKSICKNCAFSARDGKDRFCGKRMIYVKDCNRCSQFAEGKDGDVDHKVFLAFTITVVVIGFALMILTNLW